ncbi:hypothetical protein BaRGS_00016760, partial [Batillaria attramentaria]
MNRQEKRESRYSVLRADKRDDPPKRHISSPRKIYLMSYRTPSTRRQGRKIFFFDPGQ